MLNIQPVVRVEVCDELNLITRPIIPVIRRPDLINGGDLGLADVRLQSYLSPSGTGQGDLGIGPMFQVPSTTNGRARPRKWSAGPGLVVLTPPGKSVIGALANNIWSFAGSDRDNVNLMTVQPFVDYNFGRG